LLGYPKTSPIRIDRYGVWPARRCQEKLCCGRFAGWYFPGLSRNSPISSKIINATRTALAQRANRDKRRGAGADTKHEVSFSQKIWQGCLPFSVQVSASN
jgi:hypothetical protein